MVVAIQKISKGGDPDGDVEKAIGRRNGCGDSLSYDSSSVCLYRIGQSSGLAPDGGSWLRSDKVFSKNLRGN
jgi:hypothetical protein